MVLLAVAKVGKFVVNPRGLQQERPCQSEFHASAGQKGNRIGGASNGVVLGRQRTQRMSPAEERFAEGTKSRGRQWKVAQAKCLSDLRKRVAIRRNHAAVCRSCFTNSLELTVETDGCLHIAAIQ